MYESRTVRFILFSSYLLSVFEIRHDKLHFIVSALSIWSIFFGIKAQMLEQQIHELLHLQVFETFLGKAM